MKKDKQTVKQDTENGKATEDMESPLFSRRYKIRMNRFFRERVRSSYLPYPEADNLFERMRSGIILKLRQMRKK